MSQAGQPNVMKTMARERRIAAGTEMKVSVAMVTTVSIVVMATWLLGNACCG